MASSRLSSGFSWADEVEKEEQKHEEEEKINKRTNPFGFARPRELVLQEKGIDWRWVEEQQSQASNLRKEEKLKENVPVKIARTERFPSALRDSSFNSAQINNERINFAETSEELANRTRKNKSLAEYFVPPLMFPPKNLLALMTEMRRSRESDRINTKRQSNNQYSANHQEHKMRWSERGERTIVDSNGRTKPCFKPDMENMNDPLFGQNIGTMRMLSQDRRVRENIEVGERRPLTSIMRGREKRKDGDGSRNYDEEELTDQPVDFGGIYNKRGISEKMHKGDGYGRRDFAEEFVDHGPCMGMRGVRVTNMQSGGNYKKRGGISGSAGEVANYHLKGRR